MNINLIRLKSKLHAKNKTLLKENQSFIDEINNNLIDEDIIVAENAQNAVFSVVFIESGGSESEFVKILPSLKDPIVLLSNEKNNSLPACLEIKTYCHMQKRLGILLLGEESDIAYSLKQVARIIESVEKVRNTNLGVIGKPSNWLIASTVDKKEVKERFDINLKNISMNELCEEIDKDELVNNIPHLDEFKKKFKDEDVLHQALSIYSALKRLVFKYNLKGLTIRCFDLLGKYKNTACLALGLLNEEGIVSSCEGDVPSLLTMYFLYVLSGLPSFMANPSKISFKDHTVLLGHCTLPINMVEKYDLTTHFESGLGIGIKGELPLEKVTICKLAPSLKEEEITCMQGRIKENLSLPGYCRTQILVELEDEAMMTLLKDDFGNHLIVTYADVYDDLLPFLNILDRRNHR